VFLFIGCILNTSFSYKKGIVMKKILYLHTFLRIFVVLLLFSTTYAYAQNYYVDVNNGLDDADGTTIETPFKYISQAVDKVASGDTVYLRAGTYRETIKDIPSGSPENPITFKAYQNEKVTVSGAERITDWSNTNGMYSASVNSNIDASHQQLFVNGKMVFQAREPEMSNHDDPFSQKWIHMVKGKPVTLKASNGKYLIKSKDNNALHANGNINDERVKFYLVNLGGQDRNNMNCIKNGSRVAFFSTNLTDVFQIEGGGDSLKNGGSSNHKLIMKETAIGNWETFVIKRADGTENPICPNDTVAVTLMAKKYDDKGGGFLGVDLENENILSAYKNSAGENETFYMTMEPEGLFYKKNDEKNTDLNKKDDAWKGAYAWGAFHKADKGSGSWALNIAKIKSSSEGKLILEEKKRDEWWENGWYQGDVAIIGSLSALDSENEWFCENKRTLYFKPASGKNAEELNIEFKYRTWVIDSSASYLVFQNINFFSGQIKLLGSQNLFDNIKVTYGSHFTVREKNPDSIYNVSSPFINYDRGDNGIYLEGNNNQIKNSEVAYSAGSGMFIEGDNNNVQNCLIHDFGYMGTYTSGVFFDGSNSSLTYSTLFNSGRDLLHLGAVKKCLGCTYNYNLFHSSALLANDSGLIYSFGHNHGDSEIAYNWLEGRAGYKKTVASVRPGIYMDNGSRNIRIHHNVITGMGIEPGIQFNTPHEGLSATNNTIIHHENPKDVKKIGEEAYCNCNFDKNSEILPMFYFEEKGICIHNIGENKESACDKANWNDWKDKFKHEDNNYSMSIAEAKKIFRNPLESTIKENGWEIRGTPDFRPFSISEGAYEANDPNWVPGYRRVLSDESMQASLIQSNYGKKGNFEMVIREGDQLCHYERENDKEYNPWRKVECFGSNITSAPSLIQSDYGEKGNLELVVREGKDLCHYYKRTDNNPDNLWDKSECLPEGDFTSAPSLIQSNYGGEHGNFELVVREGDDKICHYYRANDEENQPWHKSECLPKGNFTSAPSLIQSNYGEQGNFEVVVREGDKLSHYWRANDEEYQPWRKSESFGQNIISAPSLIQSNYGEQGNFEVAVLEGDKLCYYARRNDKEDNPWSEPICLPKGDFTSVPSLIQSNYGEQGNFEIVVLEGDELHHYARRNDNEENPWSEPIIIVRDDTVPLYEEERDWHVYDSTPSGATISSIIDEDKGKVVQFSGAGTENGYMLGDWSGGANVWNNTTEKTITWSMKYNEDFRVYISVETEDGHRFIEYSNTRNDSSSEWSNGEYIHHGLGESVTDGTWQTFTRDLEGDLKDFERDNSIVSVNAFMIRGSGVLDDIKLLPKRIYEHAEDINTKGWMVYDNSPSGASISNIEDNGNRVIQLQGAGRKNGYILGDWIGGANVWNNTTEKIITWRMKYDEDFVVYVSVETEKGQKYLYYTNSDGNKGQSKNYIHHGIGENASDGTWQTFTRDLEADLQDLESDNSITSVNAFLIRGSGFVDDIELFNGPTVIGSLELNNAHGIVFSKDEKVAYVATYNNALQLIDISNPNSPKLLDRFSMPGVPLYITGLSDSEILVYSLLGSATYKLYKVDISDPLDLTITDVKLVSQKDIPQYNPNFEVLANLANIDYLNIENPKNIVLSNDGSLVYVIKSKRLFILRLK